MEVGLGEAYMLLMVDEYPPLQVMSDTDRWHELTPSVTGINCGDLGE